MTEDFNYAKMEQIEEEDFSEDEDSSVSFEPLALLMDFEKLRPSTRENGSNLALDISDKDDAGSTVDDDGVADGHGGDDDFAEGHAGDGIAHGHTEHTYEKPYRLPRIILEDLPGPSTVSQEESRNRIDGTKAKKEGAGASTVPQDGKFPGPESHPVPTEKPNE